MIKLYSYRRCPFAIRVRMTLYEKEIPFQIIEENLKGFSADLLKLHPQAKVPVLVDDETVIYESAIITEYVDELTPTNSLVPTSAKAKAKMRLWTYWCNYLLKPEIDHFKYGHLNPSEVEPQMTVKNITSHLQTLEDTLSKSDWLLGDHFTLADIHVFPFIRQLFKVSPPHPKLDEFMATTRWLEKIMNRPSFKNTMAK